MADENKLSSKISIDVAEAKANIGQLNREIKLLDSEFRASTAGLGDWSKSTAGVEAKQKQLTGTLEAQKAKIENLNALYQAAVEKHGEHSKAAEDLAIKINNEKAAMAETEAQLKTLGTEMDTEGEKQNKFAEGLQKGLVVAAEAAAAACAAVAAAVAEAVKTAYEWSTNVGKTADDFNTLSQQTGISAEKLQEWSYASQYIDTSLDTLTGSMTKLTSNMGKAADGSKDAVAKFEALGVAFTDADGNLRSTEDVFWDAIEALGSMENTAERDAAAMNLFGKSAQDLNPLIIAGREAFEGLGQEAEDLGIILNEDQLTLANGFNDAQNKFNSTMDGLKNSIGLLAIPAFNDLLSTAQTTMGGVSAILSDGIQDGDVEAIAEVIKTGVGDAIKQLTGIVDTVAPIITEILTSLIEIAVEALPALMPSVITAAVTALTSIAEHMPEIVTSIVEALAAVDWATVGSTVVTGVFDAIISLLSNADEIIAAVTDLAGSIAKAMFDALTNLLPESLKDMLGLNDKESLITDIDSIQANIDASGVDVDASEAAHAIAEAMRDEVIAAYGEYSGITAQDLSQDTLDKINDYMEQFEKGDFNTQQLGMKIGDAIEEDASAYNYGLLGANMSLGIANGILAKKSSIVNAMVQVCKDGIEEAQKALGIASPSKVARDVIGKNFGAGIAQGITDSVAGIETAASAAGAAAVGALSNVTNGFTVNNNIQATIRTEADIDLLAARLAARNKRVARGFAV